MSPTAVFFRTLLKSSAIFLGAGVIFINPSLDWSAAGRRHAARFTARSSDWRNARPAKMRRSMD